MLICSKSLILMSDCERFAQIASHKWATVSKSLRSLMIKSSHEQFAQGALSLTENEQFAQKCFNKIVFLCTCFKSFFKVFFKNKQFTHSLFFKDLCERVAQVAHDKRGTVSESLRLLTKNEQPWDICFGRSSKMSNHEIFTQVAHQKWANEQIAHFFWANRSFINFFAKKPAIPSENRWMNFQPC